MLTQNAGALWVESGIAEFVLPGVRNIFVRSTGVRSEDASTLQKVPVLPTVKAALSHCRSGYGDTIHVLPGHTETISTADYWANLRAGTRIIGYGHGTLRPQITYSASGATILLDVANVKIKNLAFYMAGSTSSSAALTVTAPITISAAGCEFEDCFFHVGVDADQKVTKAITTTDAADYLSFKRCDFYGATAAECTTVLEVLGSDYLHMEDCTVQAATSAVAVGVMRLNATALLGGVIKRCTFINRKALSEQAITGVAASAGVMEDCNFGILSTSGLVGFATKGDWHLYRCKTTNTTGEAGGEEATVSA